MVIISQGTSTRSDLDKREYCGAIGIYSFKGHAVAHDIYFGLMNLQHRGQDAAGAREEQRAVHRRGLRWGAREERRRHELLEDPTRSRVERRAAPAQLLAANAEQDDTTFETRMLGKGISNGPSDRLFLCS